MDNNIFHFPSNKTENKSQWNYEIHPTNGAEMSVQRVLEKRSRTRTWQLFLKNFGTHQGLLFVGEHCFQNSFYPIRRVPMWACLCSSCNLLYEFVISLLALCAFLVVFLGYFKGVKSYRNFLLYLCLFAAFFWYFKGIKKVTETSA